MFSIHAGYLYIPPAASTRPLLNQISAPTHTQDRKHEADTHTHLRQDTILFLWRYSNCRLVFIIHEASDL